MKTAEGNLKAQQPKEALSPEQRALKLLQDAEQNYEMQVRQGGGVADGLEVLAGIDARLSQLLELGVGQTLGFEDVLLERAESLGHRSSGCRF